MKYKLLILFSFFSLKITKCLFAQTCHQESSASKQYAFGEILVKKQLDILTVKLANEALKKGHSLDHVLGTFGMPKSAV